MSLWAIGDLHLSFGVEKPMNIFGEKWDRHWEKIEKNWLQNIEFGDTVLLPGDISWGMRKEEAQKDLDFIDNLPGSKVIIQGNHDYWWSSASKLNYEYENIFFLKNNFMPYKDIAVCGTRGWITPNDVLFTKHDEKIYKRECLRLRMSLDRAKASGFSRFVVMIHYPPAACINGESEFTNIFNEYKVETVVYGHLHGAEAFRSRVDGVVGNTEYKLVSADFLDFNPIKIRY